MRREVLLHGSKVGTHSLQSREALAEQMQYETAAEQFEDRREALGACLQKLKQDQRDLLQEHYIAGRTIRELSSAAGRSESAVKMIFLRLREQLSACIERQLRLAP